MALTKEEWKTAIAMVDAALLTEIPTDGGFQNKPPLHYTKNNSSEEIPDNHPAGSNEPQTGEQPQKYDTDDAPGITDEIPPGGGFEGKPALHLPDAKHVEEIPDNHPASDGPITPADWKAKKAAQAAIDYGVDTATAWQRAQAVANASKGSPDYSGETQKGWSVGKNLPKSTGMPLPKAPKEVNYAPGSAEGSALSFEPGDSKGFKHDNPTPRSSMASLHNPSFVGNGDSLTLPDGTFCIAQPGDVAAAVGKVLTAEQSLPPNPRRWMEIKRHIARRALALNKTDEVPADWQMMMAMHAELEMAKKFSAEDRERLAKTGAAMKGGQYPIEDLDDLDNAIQAYGRASEGERAAVKAHILKRAKALKAGPDVLARIRNLGKGSSK